MVSACLQNAWTVVRCFARQVIIGGWVVAGSG